MMTKCNATNNSALSTSESDLFDEQTLALQSKALSHPARIRILKILYTLDKVDGCLNSDLVSELGLAQSTVSEHLRILKSAGFITTEPMPPKTCYRINQGQLSQYLTLFNGIFS
ncbi:ArsR/SmtB family transcription factor [Vibrio sp. NTOU-M3]|uniref:ArsR/SmtB family transcription factor n=1 Tax=unclassified Vibrio TaxID=2614977 RepID=UPI0035A97911